MNYLDELAEQIQSAVSPADLPKEDTKQLFRIYAVLAMAQGVAVTPKDVHNAWVAWMSDKDPAHESLVPFADLDAATADDDGPFVTAIRQVAQNWL